MTTRYPVETLDPDDDNGTMPDNVATLAGAVVGKKIVSAVQEGREFILTLNDGTTVKMLDDSDCCAYTELNAFLLHPEMVDHFISGVGTTDGYTQWHIYADAGDVLKLTVGWSSGNPFYYGYGFLITVENPRPIA